MTTEKTGATRSPAPGSSPTAAGRRRRAPSRPPQLTDGGKLIDDYQVHAERIAQMATEARPPPNSSLRRSQAPQASVTRSPKTRRSCSPPRWSTARAVIDVHPDALGIDETGLDCAEARHAR